MVMDEDLTTLIIKKTSEDMGLLTVNYDNFESISYMDENCNICC